MTPRLPAVALALVPLPTVLAAARPPADALAAGFAQPPDASRPRTWWHWMDGDVAKEGITTDLVAMKRAGRAPRAATPLKRTRTGNAATRRSPPACSGP